MRLYFIGICGTAMGNGALLLRALGHEVSGSDDSIYPPMSLLLAEQGITMLPGYRTENLNPAPDLVIIGNAMSRGNIEVETVLDRRLPFTSLPELLKREVIQGKTSVVVTGTHGKSTTSSLMAWTLESAGRRPTFLIGGIPENFGQGYQAQPDSEFVVLEGDEYDTAFFDKRSKFIHYLPSTLIINNIEFDHADIFASIDEIKLTFRRAVNLVPRNGVVIANADDDNVNEVILGSQAPVVTFGISRNANFRALDIQYTDHSSRFRVQAVGHPEATLEIPMLGEFNVRNALAVTAAARHHGLSFDEIQTAFTQFKSIKRRLEKKGEFGGVTVYDDFAHHPTAIRATLQALRQRHPKERLIAIFEPRSNTTRRNIFQKELAECFDDANIVFMSQIARLHLLKEEERLNPETVMDDLRHRGKDAYYLPDAPAIAEKVGEVSKSGDVVIVMSNGSFGGLHDLLRQILSNAE
ncbi:MAG: UDP-N-acetylmuramate:L-alanyl-gamma-D-glutamyl-meso-diaminopimelate ligase [Bacteroidota bacterium]|nr:UDP-N-acetylmuramate:L-alanyl-gamma-D-glutamyl-meso-diaminopimelate ligase [Bacteroidota bacterium]MDP4234456.1 UDP-N-acetylmuramate:L-alanyl-gamma-D-glutamyl-meso-diaminopimelate ligase [Bacteroidota bacterium]MDP4243962.1 UDP-N-acetylmuramate:L-alanyl-gamma-D-glutamyl-meso-diaminopimelate ligase [Bacteroidota bacterium]MDP4288188.1 UDP-N-acetylmuramate:L-alanyl-gamma-D-glutamyl-meso-diaminopimelate ligase [Bacteroidota bacterium]